MNKQEWVTVGIKLIGVYFAVLGATGLPTAWLGTVLRLADSIFQQSEMVYSYGYGYGGSTAMGFVNGLQPVLYLGVAFVLIKWTGWCVRMVGMQEG